MVTHAATAQAYKCMCLQVWGYLQNCNHVTECLISVLGYNLGLYQALTPLSPGFVESRHEGTFTLRVSTV